MNTPLKKIAEAFRSDDLTHQIEAKKSEIARLEKQISVTNAEYFQHKITEPVKAAAVKEKMERLKTELESLRDDVVSLVGTHEKATRGERMAARAKERAALEQRVSKDKEFLKKYSEAVAWLDAGLRHLDETERLVSRFSRDAVEGETRIETAESSRHPPGTQVFDVKRPLAECVNLPAARHGDQARRASRLA
jgi:DNA repair exonuclease SbcCD ATPase subunit